MYKSKRNEIIDADTGEQVAIVMPSNCSKKAANAMAAYAAQQMNHEVRDRQRRMAREEGWKP